MRGRTLALYVLCCAVWGSTWLVIKLGLQDLPPFLFGGVRMTIACAALAPLAFRGGFPRLRPNTWLWIACVGFLQLGLSYAAVFAAERFISSGLTATLFCSYPIWAIALAHVMLPGERAGPLHAGSAVLGILGIVLLEAPLLGPVRLVPEVAAALLLPLGSSVCSALGSGQPAHLTPRALASLLYLAIPGTVVAFLALFWLIPRMPMALIGAIPLIDTVIALALGAAVL